MRSLETILSTRGIRLAKLSNTLKERYSAKDIFEDIVNEGTKYRKSDYMVDEEHTLAFGGDYYDTVSGKQLNFMFSVQGGWEHLSVSMPSRTPTWDQMCTMKNIFWEDEEECVEYHPPKSQYVNIHEHCLHIWKPVYSELYANYMNMGFLTVGDSLTYREAIKRMIGEDKDIKDFEDLFSVENGSNVDFDKETITLLNNVPAELLFMPTPPYLNVGTKTSKGLDIIKKIAKKNGVRVGLAIQGDEDE